MLPQILKRYDYAEIKKRMEAKGLALGEVLTREEALKDQQVAHNCASQPALETPLQTCGVLSLRSLVRCACQASSPSTTASTARSASQSRPPTFAERRPGGTRTGTCRLRPWRRRLASTMPSSACSKSLARGVHYN